nr:hypothetical protein [Tanacetum cinerariifolium]
PATATWQHPIGQPPVTWHLRQHRSAPVTTVNDAGQRRSTLPDHWSTVLDHRSTATDQNGDRRSMVAVNDGRRWRTTVDCPGPPLTTIGPPVNGGW